jgi:hypothetical protein
MNESDRADCYAAEEEYDALGLSEALMDEIEVLWHGSHRDRDLAVEKLVVATINGTGLSARFARALLTRLYR